MLSLLLTAALAPAQPPATHEAANPIFKKLLDPGLPVGAEAPAKLPPPGMADGLDAAAQKAVIKGLIGGDYGIDDFTRKSVVAPQILKIRDVTPSDPAAPARGVDAYFVVYGDLKALDDEKFLARALNAGKEGGTGKGKALTAADLAKRKIEPTPGLGNREGYGTVEFNFLDKVRLKATGHSVWSRTPDSAVAAAEIDPRFAADADFPNQWMPLTRGGTGPEAGPAKPWAGAGFYLKATRLVEPSGALFVEQHVVYVEPAGWFDGANLLRSKLPPAVQVSVRRMRTEWAKGEK